MTWNPFRARKERARRRLAAVMLAAPRDRYFGFDLSRATGVSEEVMYPMLTRWEADGWLEGGWQRTFPNQPKRRYYTLTELGRRELAAADTEGGTPA